MSFNVYEDQNCKPLGIANNKKVEECFQLCREEDGCNALNHEEIDLANNQFRGSCHLARCSLPIDVSNDKFYNGYILNAGIDYNFKVPDIIYH